MGKFEKKSGKKIPYQRRGISSPDKEKYPWCNTNLTENYFFVKWRKFSDDFLKDSYNLASILTLVTPIKLAIVIGLLVITLFLYVFSAFFYCLSKVFNRRRAKENPGTGYGGYYISSDKSPPKTGVHTLRDLK